MDVKDLRSETVVNERNNDGSKYASNVTSPCTSNKLYLDMGPSPVGKVDVPPSRPCAVIGPDRVVPLPTSNDTLKKGAYEAWCAENVYHHTPEYPHKVSSYQTPIRNISPRQTFQENMQRIMVPPSYNSLQGTEDPNFQEKNVSLTKNIKPNIPLETKYCEVPYNLTNNDQKTSGNLELCVPSVNPVLTRTATHGWPPHMRPPRPSALPVSFGASELYQYPEYTNCTGPRPMPINTGRSHRMIQEEPAHMYPDHYSHDGNARFKPYPTSKERYPQARYEYVSNYSTPLQPPSTFPPQKYDLQKPIPPPYPYPQVPLKYLDSRIIDPSIDGYQRPNPQSNYNLPFRNQMIHPAYGPVLGNSVQNKYPCPPDSSLKPVAPNKLSYDANKMYVDFENVRTKTFPVTENFYYNIPRVHHTKSQVMSNYAPVNMHGVPAYPYYRKENMPVKNYEFMPHYRNMDPSFMPISRIPSQFSPSSIAISPSESNASNEATQLQNNSQNDCGYVSQLPTASIRNFESAINRADFYRRYESRYGHSLRMSVMSKPEQNSNNKKDIDVRQFLQMWNEVDDENAENSTRDVTQLHTNDVNKASKTQYEMHKNQDQLYVLGLVNVPNEELSKYEHIQKVSKLPENIKGYNNIELLKQFEEVVESSNVNNFNVKFSTSRDASYRPLKGSMTPQTPDLLQRPVSPLDVEAKISQSVIHKEVGCNFEIKPCSPKMLNVEVATSVQTVLGERVIEKVANPLNIAPPILHLEEKVNYNTINHKDHRKSSSKNLEVSSCKMINTPFTANDLVRSNYSLQDLEINSGVCLASLPRLDNDIELNFPEVNQQFINANKGDSVITKTKDLPALTLDQSENMLTKDNENSVNLEPNMTYECSPSIVESEREFIKLSKYRKKKIDPETTEMSQSCTSSQILRTDSVIIKNPENSKTIELNKVTECTKKIPSNLSAENNTNIKAMEPNMEVALPMDIAIDFSLKSDSNNFTNGSPVSKYFYNDTNQTKESISNLTEDAKLYKVDKTDSALSQINSNIEKVKNNNTNLDSSEEEDKPIVHIKEDIIKNNTEIPNIRKSFRMTRSPLTEINDHTSVNEPSYDKNTGKTSNKLNDNNVNPVNKQSLEKNEHSDYLETEPKVNSSITLPLPDSIPKDESLKFTSSTAINNEFKESCKSAQIDMQNNSISSQNGSEESDDSLQESDSSSESISSTSIQDDTESEDECMSTETNFKTAPHSLCQKQDSTDCYKTVTENNVIYDPNVNNSLERKKMVEKLNKELLSSRIQNLLTYIEGFTNFRHGKCSDNERNRVSTKGDNGIKIENAESPAACSGLNNYEELNSSLVNHGHILNECNDKNSEKNIDSGRDVLECLKSSEISHEEKKDNKRKNMAHNNDDNCDKSFHEENAEDSSDKDSQEQNAENSCNKYDQKMENHSESVNNDMRLDTQSQSNSMDNDNCIQSFYAINAEDQVECGEMPYDDIKEDAQDVVKLKYAESIHDENSDKQLKRADISNCDLRKNPEDDSYSTQTHCADGNVCCRNTEDGFESTEISHDNKEQNVEDFNNPNMEKYSDCADRSEGQNCLGIYCNDIKQDSECDKYSNQDCIESVANSSKKNTSSEKSTPDLKDTNYTKSNIDYKSTVPEISPEDNDNICENSNNNEKEYNCPNYIKNYTQNICSNDQKVTSLEILDDNITEVTHNLKEDTESSKANIYDENVEVELESAKEQHIDQKNNTKEKPVSDEDIEKCTENSENSVKNLKLQVALEDDGKKDTLNLTSVTISDECSNNNLEPDNNKRAVEKLDDQPNDLVYNSVISNDFTNPAIVTYQDCLEHNDKDNYILPEMNNSQPFAYVDHSIKEGLVKKHPHLKRSLSESALDSLNNDSNDNIKLEWQAKRRKNMRNFISSHLFESNYCNIQNNRRKSVSAMYTDENLSFCILIDDNCIITEEDENNEEQEKICFTEISEDDLSDAQRPAYEHENTGLPMEILLCPQEDNNEYTESENTEFQTEKSFEQEDINQYSNTETQEFLEEKSFEESWVEDIACVETVISEDIAEDVIISAHSSPKEFYSSEHEEAEVFLNSEHTEKVKYIYGEKMCNDDAQFLETLYRTPQMDVNKTLISRESQMSDEFNQSYNKESLVEILSESSSCQGVHNKLDSLSSDLSSTLSQCAQIINIKDDEEYLQTKNDSPIANKTLFSNDGTDEQKLENNKLDETQDDTVHSCESSTDNVFSYTQKDDYIKNTISSSPEVSSTTSEDRNSNILLKITNCKGSRMSHMNSVEHETKRISCKFTEVNDYSASLYNGKTLNRPLITKAAQKYIPPLKETIGDLKIRLPLPEHSLVKLKQLKLLKEELQHNKYSAFSKKELPKKPKPKFEDVLKSIDEIQFQRHKENNKKTKKSIPKVVIKKNENGSHYASTTKKDMFNPDLTGRKWQPWVFLEKDHFIDNMVLKNRKLAVYSHRKNTFVLAESFRKYKSISSKKFVISQPKLDDTSIGHLKCTIRLKHT